MMNRSTNLYFFPEGDTRGTYAMMVSDLMDTNPIQVGEWQAMDVSESDLHKTHELQDVSLVWDQVPINLESHPLIPYIDYPWATDHFRERVCGRPLNPAPSHEHWPYAVNGNARHIQGKKFDHTYPERFWPKHPDGEPKGGWRDPVSDVQTMVYPRTVREMSGIRFAYGDLGDVVQLLNRSPLSRQAYLPVWFPEDTGATVGQRVPCTLGYHFMQRDGQLSVRYYLRSCDVYRHLSNDVYLTAALLNWVCDEVNRTSKHTFTPGKMVIHISSLHAFVGDTTKIQKRLADL